MLPGPAKGHSLDIMHANSRLTSFLTRAADRYRHHESQIGQHLSRAVHDTSNGTIRKLPAGPAARSVLNGVLEAGADPLLDHLANIADILAWRISAGGRDNAEVASAVTVAELIGPDGMIRSDQCRFGLLLQHAGIFYPPHHHEAEELYLVLSGVAAWQTDKYQPALLQPGSFAHHAPWQPHSIRTEVDPLLALWGWTGNLSLSTYSMTGV